MLIVTQNAQNMPSSLPRLYLGSEPVEWSEAVRDLGIMIDCRLNFSRHVTEVCSKVYSTLDAFKQEMSNAVGSDEISIKFIMLILPYISGHIQHIFNHAITTSTFPALWKHAIVRPIDKKQSPSEPADFRPISILPVFAKAFERVLNDQISAHVTGSDLLTDFQSGYKVGHITTTSRVTMERELGSMLGLLDFSKAFDFFLSCICVYVHVFV
jgi:hypothetical protein